MQGLMWRATNADGTLTYSFVEGVQASYPFWTAAIGGLFIIAGMLLMAYNCYQTIRAGRRETAAGNVVQTA